MQQNLFFSFRPSIHYVCVCVWRHGTTQGSPFTASPTAFDNVESLLIYCAVRNRLQLFQPGFTCVLLYEV